MIKYLLLFIALMFIGCTVEVTDASAYDCEIRTKTESYCTRHDSHGYCIEEEIRQTDYEYCYEYIY